MTPDKAEHDAKYETEQTGHSLRARLVRAGVELVAEEGAAGLSLRAITRRTGVSHGAPRRYFPTHNALLAAIAAVGFAELATDLAPALAPAPALVANRRPAASRLVDVGLAYVRFAERRPAMFELMFRHDLLEGAGEDLRRTTLPMFESIVTLVREATADDQGRERALCLWTNLHGTAVLVANRSLHLVEPPLDVAALVTRAVRAHLA